MASPTVWVFEDEGVVLTPETGQVLSPTAITFSSAPPRHSGTVWPTYTNLTTVSDTFTVAVQTLAFSQYAAGAIDSGVNYFGVVSQTLSLSQSATASTQRTATSVQTLTLSQSAIASVQSTRTAIQTLTFSNGAQGSIDLHYIADRLSGIQESD